MSSIFKILINFCLILIFPLLGFSLEPNYFFDKKAPWKLSNGKLLNKNDFSFVVPKVNLPDDLPKDPLTIKSIKNECMEKYQLSILQLEKSIAKATSEHPDSVLISRELAKRASLFLEAMAIQSLKKEKKEKISKEEVKNRKQELIVQKLFKNQKPEELLTVTGYIGKDLSDLEAITKEGNVREILFNWGYLFIKNIVSEFWDKTALTNVELEKINNILQYKLKARWKFDSKKLFDQKLKIKMMPSSGPFGVLNFTKKLRIQLPEANAKLKAKKLNFGLSDLFIPLSHREEKYAVDDQGQLNWINGEAYFEEVHYGENKHPYLNAVKEVRVPIMAGISGTVDMYMTLACFLGLCDSLSLTKIRLAALAELVSSRHHTAIEVLYGSKSFGFKFVLGPEYYKFIYPMDPNFLPKLRNIQNSFNSKLPDEVLNNCACEIGKHQCKEVPWVPTLGPEYQK